MNISLARCAAGVRIADSRAVDLRHDGSRPGDFRRSCARIGLGMLLSAACAMGSLVQAADAAGPSGGKPLLRISTQNKDQLESFQQSGVLDDAPYQVQWVLLPTATEESAALAARTVDINLSQGTISLTLQQGNSRGSWADGHAPVTIIAAHTPRDPEHYKTMVTIVKADGPIKTPADLKGRSITAKEGGNMYTQAVLSVDHAGLKASDVKYVNLAPSDGLVAFRSGRIDALSNNPGRLRTLIDNGVARVLLTNTDVGFPASTATVVRTADLKDAAKVEQFRDFVVRIQRWNDWKAAHIPELKRIYTDVMHLRPDDAEFNAYSSISNVDVVDDAFLKTEQHIADVVADAGGIPRRVDVRLQYDTRFNADIVRVRHLPVQPGR